MRVMTMRAFLAAGATANAAITGFLQNFDNMIFNIKDLESVQSDIIFLSDIENLGKSCSIIFLF